MGIAGKNIYSPSEKRALLILFVVLLGSYAYYTRHICANERPRLALTRSLVDRGKLDVDPYIGSNIDRSYYEGHYYSDKAPGPSFLALPIVAAMHWAKPDSSGEADLRWTDTLPWIVCRYLIVLLTVVLPSVVLSLLLYDLSRAWIQEPVWRYLLVIAYALGTMAYPFSTLFYSHQQAAAICFTAFWLIRRMVLEEKFSAPALAAVGLLLGWSVLTEYPAVLSGTVFGLLLAYYVRPRWKVVYLIAAGLAPMALLAAYNQACFGSFAHLSYKFAAHDEFAPLRESYGMGFPKAAGLREVFVGPRGLFFSSPFLVLGLAGIAVAIRRKLRAVDWLLPLSAILGFFGFTLCFFTPMGGSACGPRYLVPALPFLALFVIYFAGSIERRWRLWLVLPLVLWSIGAYLLISSENPRMYNEDETWLTQVTQRLSKGQVDWNVLLIAARRHRGASAQSAAELLTLIPPFALPLLGLLAFSKVKGVEPADEAPMPRSPPASLSSQDRGT